jgi:hypothetical protein
MLDEIIGRVLVAAAGRQTHATYNKSFIIGHTSKIDDEVFGENVSTHMCT